MQAINDGTVLQRCPKVLKADVDDEIVLMSIEQGKYYGANRVAKELWHLLENPISFGELCQKIALMIDVSSVPHYRDDILEFLNFLLEQKLVSIV